MKMTMRTFLEKVLETVEDQEMKEFAEERIAKMDMANASRKKSEKELAKAEENKRLGDRVVNEFLTDEPKTAKEIAEFLEGAEELERVTTSKVTAIMKKREDVKITDVIAKGRVVKGYSKA